MEKTQNTRHESEDVGCNGLVRGVARNLYTHQQFQAALTTKADGPFYCGACNTDAILHKCAEKADHFAHIARLSPVIGPLESALHSACKHEICDALAERHLDGKWEVERTIPENKSIGVPELRPDISGRVFDKRVAIEIQTSALTPSKIAKRSLSYALRDIALVWIIPLHEPLGNDPFRPKLYERYLHSLYFGRVYYWWPGCNVTVQPVHFAPATRYVEYREWYEHGSQQTGGDYTSEYKVIKKPNYGQPLLLDIDFERCERASFTPENERKRIPSCVIWKDSLQKWWPDA